MIEDGMDNVPHDLHISSGAGLLETLELTRAFVAVMLAEQAGPLTPVQRDLLATIQRRVTHLLSPPGPSATIADSELAS